MLSIKTFLEAFHPSGISNARVSDKGCAGNGTTGTDFPGKSCGLVKTQSKLLC